MSNIAFSVLAFVVGLFAGVCTGVYMGVRDSSKAKGICFFRICANFHDLVRTIEQLNSEEHLVIGITQHEGVYTVFFRRLADG